ncbi:nucleotide sugar dehydrogenase [Listeria kieliensis]|uniref:UDP-N-acetyl-D-mannosamine dehydrogenase n=1 Tax=Listeria kieliensis TaxID=1621700 RepID=A0A3D8TR95_9LIST|nr:nucleotide sugar dehydrogenase [Listeria kieliensis]RDX01243.1 UDP-N-acetyl-D-mannosamine dehydrogenase [Listeria kieliensis]
MNVNVIGLGYIGLPTSIVFAKHGIKVRGIDTKQDVVDRLNGGQIHIEEAGLEELFQQVLQDEMFQAATQPGKADAFIIAVPTPNRNDEFRSCDDRYVVSALEAILPILEPGNLVVVESTIAPRTMEDIVQPMIEKAGFRVGEDIFLAHCPERVLPGNIMHEMIYNPRIIGGMTEACTEKAAELYGRFVKGELIRAKAGEAELSKLMENTFRDVNIALANELAKIGQELDINPLKVIEMANMHPRVNLHQPGPGVGGHCLAVDPYFVIAAAPKVSPLIQTARAINTSMPEYVVQNVRNLMSDKSNKRVTLFGLTYKGNIDDVRESPAMEIKEMLEQEFDVRIFEPHVTNMNMTGEEACEDSSLIVVLSDHDEFRNIPKSFTDNMSQAVVFDTKNVVSTVAKDVKYFNYGSLYEAKYEQNKVTV